MAGGIDWFRWHHGSVTDPKFQLVARKAGASLPDVLAVWAYLLESASAATDRGCYGDIDAEALDCLFNFPATESRTADIISALEQRGLLDCGRIAAWEKRQPKREREGDNSTERSRKHRQAKADNAEEANATPCNAMQRQETPRGEERREEEKQELPPKGAPKRDSASPSFDPLSACPANVTPSVWADFVAHRKAKRSKLTEKACELIALSLTDIPNPDAELNRSIANGWTGVFPEKVPHGQSQHPSQQADNSAVGRVKQAIAAREAAEARAAAPGQVVAEDDRDLRAPLDGEFWNVA